MNIKTNEQMSAVELANEVAAIRSDIKEWGDYFLAEMPDGTEGQVVGVTDSGWVSVKEGRNGRGGVWEFQINQLKLFVR